MKASVSILIALVTGLIALCLFLAFRSGALDTPEEKGRRAVREAVAFQKGAREESERQLNDARQKLVLTHAKWLGVALMMYAEDYDHVLPPTDSPKEYLAPYLKDNKDALEPIGDDTEIAPVHIIKPGFNIGNLTESQMMSTVIAYKTAGGTRADVFAYGNARPHKE